MARSIADRLIQGAPLTLGGRVWRLLFTYGVLLDCQDAVGEDMLGSVDVIVSPDARKLRVVLWSLLSRLGFQGNLQSVGSLIGARDVERIFAAILQAYAASMPDPEPRSKAASTGKPMGWLDTWAAGRYELRLTDDDFEDMVPRQFHALRAAHVREMQHQELMFSRLTAYTINFSQRGVKRPLKESHFMMHEFAEPEKDKGPVTGESILAELAQ